MRRELYIDCLFPLQEREKESDASIGQGGDAEPVVCILWSGARKPLLVENVCCILIIGPWIMAQEVCGNDCQVNLGEHILIFTSPRDDSYILILSTSSFHHVQYNGHRSSDRLT